MSSGLTVSQGIEIIQQAVSANELTSSAGQNIQKWLTQKFYAPYQAEILQLISAKSFKRLDELFWEVIPFGTGGRRGPMSDIGSATMNPRTIAESAYGMASYVKKTLGNQQHKVVIAHDTRNRSREFAEICARVFAAQNFSVSLFESHRSTPELSFAVRHLGCDIGVMISASHNPPADNGFKAYWSNGGQVLPPHDKGIIDCVYQAEEIPLANFDEAVKSGSIKIIGAAIDKAFIDMVCSMSLSNARKIKAIFTPLHGVGETSCYATLKQAGFNEVSIFEPQRQPDGNFTNVPDQLPNPERPEVFGPACDEAKKTGAALVLASDPDADRLGVMVAHDGKYIHLTGNQIGALILDYILIKRSAAKTLSPAHFVVETLVTTPLIASLGKKYGLKVVDNLLVGFKYIGQTMDKFGVDKFVFGAEESLGYLAGGYARDKDASIASLYIMEHAAELLAQGKTLIGRLDELYAEHGYFLEGQISETCAGPRGKAQIQELMVAFRKRPPVELAGVKLVQVDDYAEQQVRKLPENSAENQLEGPKGDLMIFHSQQGDIMIRTAVRPSGTEPKIKFYFFAQAACPSANQLSTIQQKTKAKLEEFKLALKGWIKQQLAE